MRKELFMLHRSQSAVTPARLGVVEWRPGTLPQSMARAISWTDWRNFQRPLQMGGSRRGAYNSTASPGDDWWYTLALPPSHAKAKRKGDKMDGAALRTKLFNAKSKGGGLKLDHFSSGTAARAATRTAPAKLDGVALRAAMLRAKAKGNGRM